MCVYLHSDVHMHTAQVQALGQADRSFFSFVKAFTNRPGQLTALRTRARARCARVRAGMRTPSWWLILGLRFAGVYACLWCVCVCVCVYVCVFVCVCVYGHLRTHARAHTHTKRMDEHMQARCCLSACACTP